MKYWYGYWLGNELDGRGRRKKYVLGPKDSERDIREAVHMMWTGPYYVRALWTRDLKRAKQELNAELAQMESEDAESAMRRWHRPSGTTYR